MIYKDGNGDRYFSWKDSKRDYSKIESDLDIMAESAHDRISDYARKTLDEYGLSEYYVGIDRNCHIVWKPELEGVFTEFGISDLRGHLSSWAETDADRKAILELADYMDAHDVSRCCTDKWRLDAETMGRFRGFPGDPDDALRSVHRAVEHRIAEADRAVSCFKDDAIDIVYDDDYMEKYFSDRDIVFDENGIPVAKEDIGQLERIDADSHEQRPMM